MTRQPCKCGRRWEAKWHGKNSYTPICPGCGKTPRNCDCYPIIVSTVREEDLTEAGTHNARRYEAVVREFRRRVDEGFRATMEKAGVSEERIRKFYRKREERIEV